jgi:hypothetical protein
MLESLDKITIEFSPTHEMLNFISEIDEFKGKWNVLQNLSPERLSALRHVATIESVGSSTRIEGIKLTDREIENCFQISNNIHSNRVVKKNSPVMPKLWKS